MNATASFLCRLAAVLLATCVPLRAGLLERWTFNDVPSAADGTAITGLNSRIATIRGSGALSTGTGISLPGGSSATQAYIDLPNGLISPLTDLTVEVWLTLDTLQNWQRVFDFGSTTSGELTGPGGSGTGNNYIVLAPNRGTDANANAMHFFVSGSAVSAVDTAVPIPLGTRHFFTYVWKQTGPTAIQSWYLDGVLQGQSTSFTGSLSLINDVNNWLGRSNWTADSNTDGTYDECAIYDHAMSATEVQARFTTGPLPNTPPVYEKMFDFTQAREADVLIKGSFPSTGLLQGSDGNFYGTTSGGMSDSDGTVFRITPAGVLNTLVEFTRIRPNRLVEGSDGSFYGTTDQGGVNQLGTVFRMTPAGALTTLVEFTGNGANNKGRFPSANLVQGSDGNFYGTTLLGGANGSGTIFKMTPSGILTTLVEFTGNGASNKGRNPEAGLVQGNDGCFYGTTRSGGVADNGTVFKMTPLGALTTLVEFTGNGASNKGRNPEAGLVQGSDGSFYGTTA